MLSCAGLDAASGPSGALTIGGSLTTGSLSLGGAAQTGAIYIGGNASTPISVLGSAVLNGSLSVTGNVSFPGNSISSGCVYGPSYLTMAGNSVASGSSYFALVNNGNGGSQGSFAPTTCNVSVNPSTSVISCGGLAASGNVTVGASGGLTVAAAATFSKLVGFSSSGYALQLENGCGIYVKGGTIQMGTGAAGYVCNFNLQTNASAQAYPMKFWDTTFDQTYAAASVPNEILQLRGYLTAYSGVNFNKYGTAPASAITYNFIGYNSVLQDYNLNIAGINSTSSGTVLTSSLKYLKGGALYYQPSSYGGVVSVSAATAKLLAVANAGTLCAWYHVSVTYTTTTPALTLPDPVAALAGCEVKFVRAGASNALNLTTVTPASSNFLISASATNISPTFGLASTWYKVGFVCLPNPDATSTPYCWQQILYQ